jgi:YbgC/YbaW family acyl-CoA thioester hydrolase
MPAMTRDEFRFFHPLRVRWAEVDMQRIVFNAHYLMYFDTAIGDYWRALAMPYVESMELLEGDMYVVKATVEFHASAHADEMIDVALRCTRMGNSSMTFTGAIFRGEQHLISAEIVYVFADPATQTSKPIPAAFRAIVDAYEAGEALAEVRVGDWATLGEAAKGLREMVFVQEQAIPLEIELDEADATAVHAVAFNRLGQVIATGRLLSPEPGVAKIGRMAVHRFLRGGGWGRGVLDALMAAARERGDREVVLHAQRTAEGFYRRQGFAVRGEPFTEAGIVHVEMVKPL